MTSQNILPNRTRNRLPWAVLAVLHVYVLTAAPSAFLTETVALNTAWAEASFAAHPSPSADQMILLHEDSPGDTKINLSATGGALRLGEKTYTRGIGTNSRCEIRVRLSRPAVRFVADIGIDRNVEVSQPASAEFRVLVGGNEVFASGVMRPGDGVQSIDVPLGDAREFDLVIDDGGDGRSYDQGNWADARIVLADGSTLWLDELAASGGPVPELPFSFVYGGKPSADLLPKWKSEIKDEKPDATRKLRTLIFTDPDTGLVVKAVVTIYLDTPGADWTLHFTNSGSKATPILEQVRAVDVRVVPSAGRPVTFDSLMGCHRVDESWMPIQNPLTPGTRIAFGGEAGRPARTHSPFFTVDWATGGVITAVGWSGQWNGSVAAGADGLRIEAGMEFLHTTLEPGESIRSPRILQVYWKGEDIAEAQNQFRRTMLAHIVPKRDGKPVFPPIAHLSTSFYELNATDEASTLSHLESMDGLGFEALWLDAYWHRDGFAGGIGHYGFPLDRVSDPVRFPNGIKPVAEAVHKKGLKFLLWFEPERVSPGTSIAQEHPEWVINAPGDHGFNSGLFDLGNPAAREFMTTYLAAAIKEYGVDILRIDYNINPLPFWQEINQKNPDRVGISEIRYVEGLYKMWDDLRSEFPGLDIDNCASGGMRVDLETVSRAITLWRTDYTIDPLLRKDYNQAALQNQVMTAGLNRYLPFSVSGQMGASPYLFRSGFNGGIAFAEDTRPADYPRDQLRDAIAEGKRLRKYYTGDFYPLADVTADPRDWTVMQYNLSETGEGVVIGFRRHKSPFTTIQCELRGIDPAATYEVTRSISATPEAPVQMMGSELQKLSLQIPEMPGSVVLEYKKTIQ